MTSREQDREIDRLALAHGGVAVRDGFTDEHIDVTLASGQCFTVSIDGQSTETHPNHSIRWAKESA